MTTHFPKHPAIPTFIMQSSITSPFFHHHLTKRPNFFIKNHCEMRKDRKKGQIQRKLPTPFSKKKKKKKSEA